MSIFIIPSNFLWEKFFIVELGKFKQLRPKEKQSPKETVVTRGKKLMNINWYWFEEVAR